MNEPDESAANEPLEAGANEPREVGMNDSREQAPNEPRELQASEPREYRATESRDPASNEPRSPASNDPRPLATTEPRPLATGHSRGSDVVALAPPPAATIATRRRVARTGLAGPGIIKPDEGGRPAGTGQSIVTRRNAMRRRRRRKQLLTALVVVLAIFPPMWAVYLLAWLYWRSRPRQKSMRITRKAIHSLEKNRKGVALQQLQEAHLKDPSNSDALYWLGLLLSRQERHEEAAEALSLVADRVPGLPEVESALVDAYIATGRPESAVYHAQRMFDAAPYAPEAPLKLAEAFEAAGRLDLAIQALEQAPLHKRTLTGPLMEIHYRLGDLYERQGERGRALEHFKRVYARDVSFRDIDSRLAALE